MTTAESVPYADLEPISELAEECRCVEAECTAHGVDLHHAPVHHNHAPTEPVRIGETTRHLLDGLPDYGC